jgi:predicted nucleic acid-binding protein
LKLFVDTWGWLALADRNEPRHREVATCYAKRSSVIGCVLTSNFVLDEFLTILFSRRPFHEAERFSKALFASPFVAIEQVTPERFESAFKLRLKLADKPKISFTDLTSIIIMNETGVSDILTADKHFAHVGLALRLLPE